MRFLFCTSPARAARAAQTGFTLIELLVVLAIIAAVAGVGVQVFTGVTEDSERALARAEMDNIASAIQRFHRDTGYWPEQGPFAKDCVTDKRFQPDRTLLIVNNPANLAQLRFEPFEPVSQSDDTCDYANPTMRFDVASGTGWNGPYLRELDTAIVTTGSGLGMNGTGSPTAGNELNVWGIGDPFIDQPVEVGNKTFFEWRKWHDTDSDGDLDALRDVAKLGRPYLYLWVDGDADGIADGVPNCHMPCLVSMGPDGTYNQGGGDDIVVNIAGN